MARTTKNVPLTREEVKKLPIQKWHFENDKRGGLRLALDFNGFTPTGIYPNNHGRRSMGRTHRLNNNRATTPGRVFQQVPNVTKTPGKFGVINVPNGTERKVFHPNRNMKTQYFRLR